MSYNVHLTRVSQNAKTGPIPVSTTSAATCAKDCPLIEKGCYAKGGPLAIHWRKVTEGLAGMAWDAFTSAIAALPKGQLWRHNQAGDLPGNGVTIDAEALRALVKANKGKRGFTYTHYSPSPVNAPLIAEANREGFTINLSGNNLSHADRLAALGIAPVVTLLPQDIDGNVTKTVLSPAGNTVVVCPATYLDSVSCATCALCQHSNRKTIVGFPAHGAAKRKATAVANG